MPSPSSIPDHTLLRPIGRGAYGEVWLARNVMGALRAIKIIRREQFESERPYEREFAGIQRYEPLSRSTDGLVHVLHVGRNDAEGCFYYVMELADNGQESGDRSQESEKTPSSALTPDSCSLTSSYTPRTLRSDLKRLGRLPTADCLRLALDVVSGLARLHHQGLVHRDVKPGNIIYVNGRAKLADIGLVSTGGEGRTFVGTEGYIPPEGPGSPVADLYALGVVLYEASTGYLPERFPDAPPEWFSAEGHGDAIEFHEVILKACEGARERRYQSAEEMQADLALLQSGQSVRRVRTLERRVAWARRAGWAAVAIAVVAVAGVLFAGWRAKLAEQASAKESALRTRAEAAEQDARQKLYSAYLAQARATVLSGEMGRRFRALDAVRAAAAIHNTPELRREAFAALALPDLRVEREIDLGGRVNGVGLDPAFTRYAVARGRGPVEVYSLSNQQLLARLPTGTNLNAQLPQFSRDGRYLAFKRDHASGGDSDLEVWNLVTTQRVVLALHAVAHGAISFHPRAPRLLAGRPSGRLVTWDLERGEEVMSWRVPPHWSVSYSPDGTRFAVAYDQGRTAIVETRDASDGSVLASATFSNTVFNLYWHQDGRRIAVPCSDGSVNVMNADDGSIQVLGRHKAQAVRGGLVPGGDFLFSGGWDGEVNFWNLRDSERELTATLGGIYLQFGADGRQAALVADERRLRVLEFASAAEGRELSGEIISGPRVGKFSADDRWLAVPALDGLAVWDLAQPGPAAVARDASIGLVYFRPEPGELLGASDRRLFRWRLTPASAINAPPRLEALSAVETRGRVDAAHRLTHLAAILVADADGVRLVPHTNASASLAAPVKTSVFRSAISRDEQWFAAAAARSPMVRLFRLPELVKERQLTNAAPVRALAFAPDGRVLAVLTDTNLCLWDTANWRITQSRPVQTDVFSNLAYAPNGRILMLLENARSGALLDARTLEPLLPLPTWVHPLALSSDSRQLVVSVESRRVQLWDLAAVRARFREMGIDWED